MVGQERQSLSCRLASCRDALRQYCSNDYNECLEKIGALHDGQIMSFLQDSSMRRLKVCTAASQTPLNATQLLRLCAGRVSLGSRPLQLALNCNETKLAFLDVRGCLRFTDWPIQHFDGQTLLEGLPSRQVILSCMPTEHICPGQRMPHMAVHVALAWLSMKLSCCHCRTADGLRGCSVSWLPPAI